MHQVKMSSFAFFRLGYTMWCTPGVGKVAKWVFDLRCCRCDTRERCGYKTVTAVDRLFG